MLKTCQRTSSLIRAAITSDQHNTMSSRPSPDRVPKKESPESPVKNTVSVYDVARTHERQLRLLDKRVLELQKANDILTARLQRMEVVQEGPIFVEEQGDSASQTESRK
jgi:hypothetical protein